MLKHIVKILSFLFLSQSITACASSLPQERRDYIEAHPHGWFELAIDDIDIPNVLSATEEKPIYIKPSVCNISVTPIASWFYINKFIRMVQELLIQLKVVFVFQFLLASMKSI